MAVRTYLLVICVDDDDEDDIDEEGLDEADDADAATATAYEAAEADAAEILTDDRFEPTTGSWLLLLLLEEDVDDSLDVDNEAVADFSSTSSLLSDDLSFFFFSFCSNVKTTQMRIG